MSKFVRDLAAGADHINVKLTGPLSKGGGTFKWSLNKPISNTKMTIKGRKTGYDVTISFHVDPNKVPKL